MTLDDDAESWDVPIVGYLVDQVWFSGRLYFIACDPASGWTVADLPQPIPTTKVAVGGTFTFTSSEGVEHSLDGGAPWAALVPVLELRRVRIDSARVDRRGTLQIGFANGAVLVVAPVDRFENWELVGPGTLWLAGTPGGGDPRLRL